MYALQVGQAVFTNPSGAKDLNVEAQKNRQKGQGRISRFSRCFDLYIQVVLDNGLIGWYEEAELTPVSIWERIKKFFQDLV